jgi:hypothetical protein
VPLLEIFLLAVASMFWPLLLVVVIIAFEASQPARILISFYAGGFLTATSVAMVLVFGLQDSPLMTGRRLPSAPWLDVGLGAAAVVLGYGLLRVHRRRERRRARREAVKKPSRTKDWIQHLVEHGARLAFAGGVVGSIVPGPLVLVALASIAQLGYSTIATVVVILVFFVIVFAFIEVPIAGFLLAPEWTKATTVRVKAWLDGNMLLLGAWALIAVGSFEVVRGLISGLR